MCVKMIAAVTIILAAVSLRSLEAIIVDSSYMSSAPEEQVDNFLVSRVNKHAVVRERQNEIDYDQYTRKINKPAITREQQNEVDYEQYPTVKPLYKYGYSVFDPYTLDVKSQWEHRDGDVVRGAYNMLEADGSLRIVEYTSDKDTGFRAIVKKIPFFMEQIRRPVETFSQITKNQIQQNIPAASPTYHDSSANRPTYHHNEVNRHYTHQTDENHVNNYQKQQQYHGKQKKSPPAMEVYKKLLPTNILR